MWGQWAQCSSECGGGIQTRTRTCQSPPEESYLCEGVVEEGRPCNSQPCRGELLILHVCLSSSFHNTCSWAPFLRFVVKYERVACAKCVCSYFLFPFLHLVYMCVCPSSVSLCFDLRSACWNGDFDRWKITMACRSNVFKTMHGYSMSKSLAKRTQNNNIWTLLCRSDR